jgi:hypothetical protein
MRRLGYAVAFVGWCVLMARAVVMALEVMR